MGTQPTGNVVFDVSSSDTGEASVSSSTLNFTTGDWSSAQTITITGVNDNIDDGDQFSTITVSVNGSTVDATYTALDNQTVNVTTTDNDTAGFTVSESGGSTSVSETGTTDTLKWF